MVTGGAGFIGSHIAKKLIKDGYRVIVVDNLLTGYRRNVPQDSDFIYMDLANEGHYYKLKHIRPKAILHLAGQSSGEISFESPTNDLDINTRATILLARWAVSVGCKRFLYASSVSVYGNGVNNMPMAEKGETLPVSFYGCSKLASERYLNILSDAYDLKTTCFRMFNVYGPGQDLKNMKQGMVSIYLSYLLTRNKLIVKGPLERFRDFIYITDVGDMWTESIEDPQTYNKIFNQGSGVKTTVRSLIEHLRNVVGKPKFPVKETRGTPGDSFGSVADMTYVKSQLKWQPKVNLKKGLEKTLDFYTRHEGSKQSGQR
jgi:UDP-glucose 4-epimerase